MIERLVAIFVVFFVRPSVIYFERKMPGQRLVSPQSRPRHSFFSSAREAGLQGGEAGLQLKLRPPMAAVGHVTSRPSAMT